MLKRLLIGLLLAAFATMPIAEARINNRQVVMAQTEVATGAPVTATIENVDHATGYLLVKTENETATASLVVTVYNSSTLGDFLVCTSSAITTETTTVIMLGHFATAAGGITDVCDFALSRKVKFTFTTSGAGADFDVTADIEWIWPGA